MLRPAHEVLELYKAKPAVLRSVVPANTLGGDTSTPAHVSGTPGTPAHVSGTPGTPVHVSGIPGTPAYVSGTSGIPAHVSGTPGIPSNFSGTPGTPNHLSGTPGTPAHVSITQFTAAYFSGTPGIPRGSPVSRSLTERHLLSHRQRPMRSPTDASPCWSLSTLRKQHQSAWHSGFETSS